MTKNPMKVTVEEVFDVMAKHDFNVKSASQELQIKKSRIYNIKSRNKEKWNELMEAHGKEKSALEGQPRTTGVIRVADHEIDRENRGVKSEMESKYVGKTFKITDDDEKKQKPLNVMRSPKGEDLKAENARLVQQNKELGEALERANADKAAYVEEHNELVDDFKAVQKISNRQLTEIREKDSRVAALEYQLSSVKAEAESEVAELKYKLQVEAEKTNKHPIAEDGPEAVIPDGAWGRWKSDHQPSGYYAVQLGKKFVTRDLELEDLKDAAYGDPELVKALADDVGGKAQAVVLVDIEEGQE